MEKSNDYPSINRTVFLHHLYDTDLAQNKNLILPDLCGKSLIINFMFYFKNSLNFMSSE